MQHVRPQEVQPFFVLIVVVACAQSAFDTTGGAMIVEIKRRAQSRSSSPRKGCPPMRAWVGYGTSTVRTTGLIIEPGYNRFSFNVADSGSSTGANRTNFPCTVTSRNPTSRTSLRNVATAKRLATSAGGCPYRSTNSSCTSASCWALVAAAILRYASRRNRSCPT